MKYFLDTEFSEDGKTIDLISIGIVREDGAELYLVNHEAQLHLASLWVRQNVLPLLPKYGDPVWRSRAAIKRKILDFVESDTKPEFWAYYADYDWVVFCQLFGTMMDLPNNFPMMCMDIKQLAIMKGVEATLPKQEGNAHNALDDARWNKKAYEFLVR